jgi:hypothetical protein
LLHADEFSFANDCQPRLPTLKFQPPCPTSGTIVVGGSECRSAATVRELTGTAAVVFISPSMLVGCIVVSH